MIRISTITIMLLLSIITNINPAFTKDSTNLTIFSESNMVYALTEIARSYSMQDNAVVSIDFNSSFELIENIDSGEPADVFISSHKDWIENLKQKGLVDVYNLSNIAKDKLVIVTSNKNERINADTIKNIDDVNEILHIINDKKVPLIIDSEYSSLGRYTRNIIKKANIENHLIFYKVHDDKKSIIDFINENYQYYGIVLASETKNHDDIKIMTEIPDINIYYQALVIAGDNMEEARDFLKFLTSSKARRILANSGFINN